VKKSMLAAVALVLGSVAGAADNASLEASCSGLDDLAVKSCLDIIKRYQFGALTAMRIHTLSEKTAFSAIMAADPKAVVVVLPTGSSVLGRIVSDRVIAIPCNTYPCK
jgi:hypothetical protein